MSKLCRNGLLMLTIMILRHSNAHMPEICRKICRIYAVYAAHMPHIWPNSAYLASRSSAYFKKILRYKPIHYTAVSGLFGIPVLWMRATLTLTAIITTWYDYIWHTSVSVMWRTTSTSVFVPVSVPFFVPLPLLVFVSVLTISVSVSRLSLSGVSASAHNIYQVQIINICWRYCLRPRSKSIPQLLSQLHQLLTDSEN